MKKSAIEADPGYFRKYIDLAGDGELDGELEDSLHSLETIDAGILERVGDRTYSPGKWTLKAVLQHMIDTERVFQYRALRFARNDRTPLHGFEQDDFARNAGAEKRDFTALLEELKTVRRSTILLFGSLPEEALQRTGMASGAKLSVLALGFLIIGHQVHHLNIIRTRYLPLATP